MLIRALRSPLPAARRDPGPGLPRRHHPAAAFIAAALAVIVPAGTATAFAATNTAPTTHSATVAVTLAKAAKKSPQQPEPKAAQTTAQKTAHKSAPKTADLAVAKVAAAPVNPYAHVTISSLEPTGLYGSQQTFTPSSDQWANAKDIVRVAEKRGMPLYAAVIAVATAMQESSLKNLTAAVNYDSLGLFQQRPSMGWGTPEQLTDPGYATNAFLAAMAQAAPDYMTESLWEAAQATQRSGFPTAYAQWEDQAAHMTRAIVTGAV
jgi:hypothetical protein